MWLEFCEDDILLSAAFLLLPGLSEDVIISAATLQEWCIEFDFEYERAIEDIKVAEL